MTCTKLQNWKETEVAFQSSFVPDALQQRGGGLKAPNGNGLCGVGSPCGGGGREAELAHLFQLNAGW